MFKKCKFVMLMLAVALLCAPRAHAQLFGGGQDNEKILQTAFGQLRQASRLAVAGKFPEVMDIYNAQIAALEAGMKNDEGLKREALGKDNAGPTGDEMLEKFQKLRAQLLDLSGKSDLTDEDIVKDVFDDYENAKRDFSGANTDFLELSRFLATDIARLQATFGRAPNFRNIAIPKQERVETTGAQLLASLQKDLIQARQEVLKRDPQGLAVIGAAGGASSSAGGGGAGKEPTTTERRLLTKYLTDFKHASDKAREPTLDERESSLSNLSGAADAIEKLIKEYPALANAPVLLDGGEPSNQTAVQLAAKYRQEHGVVVALRTKAAAEEQKRTPNLIAGDLENYEAIFGKIIQDLTANTGESKGFLPLQACQDRGYQLLTNTNATLGQLSNEFAAAYKGEGKTMPATIFSPLKAQITKAKALIDQRAPSYTFAGYGFNVRLAAVEGDVRRILGRQYPGAVLARVGFDDKGWEILKNDLGITTGRQRDAVILYKMPGEKWSRLQYVSYYQTNVAGTTFSDSGVIVWMNFRFQGNK